MFQLRSIGCIAAAILGVCIGTGCSTVSVKTEYDKVTDFAALQSYAWLPNQPEVKGDSRLNYAFIESHVKHVVDRFLAAEGYRMSDDPDFRVGFRVSLKDKVEKSLLTRPEGAAYEPGAGLVLGTEDEKGWAVREAEPEYEIRHYEQGRLKLQFVDAYSSRVLWSGRIKAEVDRQASDQDKKAQIEKTVLRVLAHFPPKKLR